MGVFGATSIKSIPPPAATQGAQGGTNGLPLATGSTPGAGPHYHTQYITASAALTPPTPGMYLVNIRILGGVGPGCLKILYSSPNIACFPWGGNTNVAASGVDWNANVIDYPVTWQIQGTNIPAAAVSLIGKAPTEIELTYCTVPGTGPDISAYRGSTGATLTSSAVSTVTNTITFESQPAKPKYMLGLVGWGSGTFTGTPDVQFQMPVDGPYTQQFQAQSFPFAGSHLAVYPVTAFGEANTLVLNMVTNSLGNATTVETIVVAYY